MGESFDAAQVAGSQRCADGQRDDGDPPRHAGILDAIKPVPSVEGAALEHAGRELWPESLF